MGFLCLLRALLCTSSNRTLNRAVRRSYCFFYCHFHWDFSVNLHVSSPQIDNLDPRGVQLAALFMSGVDMALFANDACGQPIPWEHCCPWMYFDGKLLQSKLIRANKEKAQLIDLCDGQVSLSTQHTPGSRICSNYKSSLYKWFSVVMKKPAIRSRSCPNSVQEFHLFSVSLKGQIYFCADYSMSWCTSLARIDSGLRAAKKFETP